MTQRPHSRHLALALLCALAAALLAACGGAPAAQPTAAPAAQGPAAEPTAAAAAPVPPGGAAGMSAADTLPREDAAGEGASPAGVGSSGAGAPAMAAPTGAPAATSAPAGGDASSAADAPRRPVGQEASLRAGEIDDNFRFDDYLSYLQSYQGGGVRPADVSERYLISVLDENQRPLLDAKVTIYDGERPIWSARTYAGGRTVFHPGLVDAANAGSFRVVAELGGASAETSFERGAAGPVELGLRGVGPDSTLRLDLLFLLDTTGSMGDELSKIQGTIEEIAARIDAFTPRPAIRYGLVAYKDVGDAYVTLPFPFTTDLAEFQGRLNQLSAQGGGDTPEALDEALYDAVVRADWSQEPAVRLAFLVADAAPHVPGSAQFTYLDGAREAVARGVKFYPIAASNTDAPAEYVFRQLAQQTLGGFVFLTYQPGASGGAPGESTTLEAGDQAYTVERLDDLIVGIVERELAAAVGAR